MSSTPAQVQDILNYSSQWPASFPDPAAATRVLTYVFEPNNSTQVELLLNLIKTKYPTALVSVVKDSKGFTSVSVTQVASEGQSQDPDSVTAAYCTTYAWANGC
jgi:hypothetical protein